MKNYLMIIIILGVNPEHMLVPKTQSNGRGDASGRVEERAAANRKIHRYIQNLITSTEIISPEDDRVKLTETMKKECEGKIIYYNSEHTLDSGEDFKLGVTDVQSKDKQSFEKMLPRNPLNQTRNGRSICSPDEIRVSESMSHIKTYFYPTSTRLCIIALQLLFDFF